MIVIIYYCLHDSAMNLGQHSYQEFDTKSMFISHSFTCSVCFVCLIYSAADTQAWIMLLHLIDVKTLGYTWSGFEAAKTAPWPSRGLHHLGKFLEPSDE